MGVNDSNEKKEQTDEEQKNKKKKSSFPKALIIAVASLTGLSVAAVVTAKQSYDYAFARYERPDYTLVAGQYCYDRVSDEIKREERAFYSDGVKLQGYYYPRTNAKGLIVFCHGLHAGADDYLPFFVYLVQNGYAVFSYDCKGTYSSEGDSTVGMCEMLVDLDHALNYVESCSDLNKYPLFLIGHSMGGYAVASVLSLHREVKGCAAIAAPNNGYTLIVEKGERYAGKFASAGLPKIFLDAYQKILFGNYTTYNGVDGINSANIPVLIAHGDGDKVIDLNGPSLYSHKNEIRSDNVEYMLFDGNQNGHNSVLHSAEAEEYRAEIDEQLSKMKKNGATYAEQQQFVASVNHKLYSAVNTELFSKIVAMFDSASKK